MHKSYLSWHWRVIQTLKENWLFIWKMTSKNWWMLTRAVSDILWGSLGTSTFGNSSSDANDTQSRLPSRLAFISWWRFYQHYFSSIFNPSASAFSMFLVIIFLVMFISFLVENYLSLVPYVNKKLRNFS